MCYLRGLAVRHGGSTISGSLPANPAPPATGSGGGHSRKPGGTDGSGSAKDPTVTSIQASSMASLSSIVSPSARLVHQLAKQGLVSASSATSLLMTPGTASARSGGVAFGGVDPGFTPLARRLAGGGTSTATTTAANSPFGSVGGGHGAGGGGFSTLSSAAASLSSAVAADSQTYLTKWRKATAAVITQRRGSAAGVESMVGLEEGGKKRRAVKPPPVTLSDVSHIKELGEGMSHTIGTIDDGRGGSQVQW